MRPADFMSLGLMAQFGQLGTQIESLSRQGQTVLACGKAVEALDVLRQMDHPQAE